MNGTMFIVVCLVAFGWIAILVCLAVERGIDKKAAADKKEKVVDALRFDYLTTDMCDVKVYQALRGVMDYYEATEVLYHLKAEKEAKV